MKRFLFFSMWTLFIFSLRCTNFREEEKEKKNVVAHNLTGWMKPESENFHGNEVKKLSWNFEKCKKCHGEDFAGDKEKKSCPVCHNGEEIEKEKEMPHPKPGSCLSCHKETPEACNTCHGNEKKPRTSKCN